MFPFGSLYQHSDQLLSPLKIIFYFSQREIRGAVGLPRLAWIRQAWCSTPFFFLVSLLHLPSLYHFQMQCAASSPGCLTHGLQSHTLCASGLWPLWPPFSLSWAGALCCPHLRFRSSLDSPSYQADDGWPPPLSLHACLSFWLECPLLYSAKPPYSLLL